MLPDEIVTDPVRLDAIAAYEILDTSEERAFDDIAEITAAICDVPTALVSFVTDGRQWFKARVGFPRPETDLDGSVCRFALAEPDLLVIPDLTRDGRTRANPLVTGEPGIRFYAGAPLRTSEGLVLGSLCAIDTAPRPDGLTTRQADALRRLARQVMDQLELRRSVRERDRLLAERGRAEGRRLGLLTLGDQLRELGTAEEMAEVAAAIVGETLNVRRVGYGQVEADEWVVIDRDWAAPGVASVAGRHRLSDYGGLGGLLVGEPVVISDVVTDERTASRPQRFLDLGIRALLNMPVRQRGRTVALLFAHDGVPRTWTPDEVTFVGNVADRVEAGRARLRAEAEQRVLNLELSHRMKNSFAMVQAIASQTLKTVSERGSVDAFMKRLHALASAHDVLLQRSWAAARIGDVVRGVVGAAAAVERFRIEGPEIEIGPRATLSLSLLLHELATNASKYGSMSNVSGTVRITWRLEALDGTGELVLTWTELGGPVVAPGSIGPAGFGSRLIRMGLVGAGGSELRYGPAGLVAEFRTALSDVQHS